MSKIVPVIYTGRIDLPISIDGQIFVNDFKTTSMLGDMFWNEMRMTAQQRGYVWAFQELTGKPVAGYMITALRTKEPPQYVTNGTSRGGKSQSPEQWWNESFDRQRFLLDPVHITEWKHNTIDLVEEFFWHYGRGHLPQKTKWCNSYGKCPYFDVCLLHPNDRPAFLQSGLFADNVWSPLKQPTQSRQ